ncbi:MAG: hypothetical protein LBB09_03255 [Rickettsiales bacterium]|jgi:cell division protein FtsB|nr:hypothetical protein [Rickettsiales bacterium]
MEEGKKIYSLLTGMVFHLLAIAYCAVHFLNGGYGYISHKNFEKNISQRRNYYNEQLKKNEKKKNKIARLSRKNLDLDLLEEELKKNTPMAGKNEIIIFFDDFKN